MNTSIKVIFALGVWGCLIGTDGWATTPLELPDPSTIATTDKSDHSAICLIEPSMEVDVGTPTDGTLKLIRADRGDLVEQNQLLAQLDSSVQEAAANVLAAKAAYGARRYERNADLHKRQLLSSQELDEIATEQKLAELELKERQEQIRLRSIYSPIRGIVVDRYRNRGDLVKQERIFRIAQLDPLHVETVLPASQFGHIKIGQLFEVVPKLVGSPFLAKVATIDRVIDAASSTFRVRLIVPNPKFELPPGQRCSINFEPVGINP
ncbi:MAG: efflux RND transporter periplasmic adaptor subunit [Magnetococcales bacterium]|nr:efflux RND transporter periplasmic adaptor subunit [Magnetococcales bacterium]MBF0148463.1 efflux RND transporter periplasmic adaptor subunit [Magnetococcales bacterium]MBF0172610.1 efflux RND transporter periplasmic adaptor subunit [Magnetococcales bacterium]MBF0346281.1 efflux RND transporter periplasmic adaptor subunit [Magnetococcales bacterium]MBF0629940.1 efflux RND transporter periplasmic adaptor subunit [Magnetococcales bacterium]